MLERTVKKILRKIPPPVSMRKVMKKEVQEVAEEVRRTKMDSGKREEVATDIAKGRREIRIEVGCMNSIHTFFKC